MLKALHSLQKENQRLQEQIMTLTAKKERLQLLNVQLSVPFPVVTSSNGPGSQAQYILPPNGEGTGGLYHPVPFHSGALGWAGGGHSGEDLTHLSLCSHWQYAVSLAIAVAMSGSTPDSASSLLSSIQSATIP